MSGGSGVNWSSVGTIAGAGIGFMVGGPAGAMVGASLGGAGGNIVGDIVDPQDNSVDTSWANAGAGEQGLMNRLNTQATDPNASSVAQLQLQQGLGQANNNAMALAASQRGINPGLAASLASRQQALNQTEANQQSGLLRAQEAQNANQLQASMYASQRGSAQSAAALQQQANQASQQRQDNILGSIGNAGLMYAMSGNKDKVTPQGNSAGGGSVYGGDNVMVASNGGKVPGKPLFGGDHPKNDTVPAMLSPGEIVIPRTVVKMGPEAITAFAQAVAKQGVKQGA